MKRTLLISSFLCALTISSVVFGADDKAKRSELVQKSTRLKAFKPNSIAWEITPDDDGAFEANYSFRYMLTRPDCSVEREQELEECVLGWETRREWFLTYTGKFDFYMGTRNSGPVVNRTSNPALHWRIYNPSFIRGVNWISFALEHRSNGQVTDHRDTDGEGRFIADVEWKRGNRAYIDGISRGANFFSVEVRKDTVYERTKLNFYLSAKAYITADSDVTWGSRRLSDDKIWDYDVFRLAVTGNSKPKKRWFPKEIEYTVEYTFGLKGFKTDSLDVTGYFPFVYGRRTYFPINFIKLHVGPMNELSNYTEPQTSISVGLKLNPWPEF